MVPHKEGWSGRDGTSTISTPPTLKSGSCRGNMQHDAVPHDRYAYKDRRVTAHALSSPSSLAGSAFEWSGCLPQLRLSSVAFSISHLTQIIGAVYFHHYPYRYMAQRVLLHVLPMWFHMTDMKRCRSFKTRERSRPLACNACRARRAARVLRRELPVAGVSR